MDNIVSDTAIAFGAKVEVTRGSNALCLVSTRASPMPAINAVGGKVLARLAANKIIAVVDMSLFAQLQQHPDVLSAGAISVDPQRFARFQKLVGG